MKAPLARLIAGHVCLHASMSGVRLAAPLCALRDGQSAVAVGVLLALFSLSQVFLSLPAGRYVDRHGLRRPVRLAVGVAMTGCALAAITQAFWALCVAALLTGGATGAAAIALQRHAGRIAGDATALKQVFSWLALGPALSNFLGPFAAGVLIDTAGFRLAFSALAALPLAAWLAVRAMREPPRAAPPAGGTARAWDLLAQRDFRRLMIVNWVLASCWDVHTFVVPVIGHDRGFSASAIGAVLGAFALAAAAVRLLMPLLAHRLREGHVIAGAMLATAAVFAVYPLAGSALAMGALSVLLGFALGSVQPMVMSTLHQITPAHRHGEALGLRMMAINGSSVLMPLLFGSVGVWVGAPVLFWAVGLWVGVSAPLAWRLRGH